MEKSWALMVKTPAKTNQILTKTNQILTKTAVINKSYGGFHLSKIAEKKLSDLKGKKINNQNFATIYNSPPSELYIARDDKDLIAVVKELGEENASGDVYGFPMKIKIITFPFNSETEKYYVMSHDGAEEILIIDENGDKFFFDEYKKIRNKVL